VAAMCVTPPGIRRQPILAASPFFRARVMAI
jgi:hypothetical protein